MEYRSRRQTGGKRCVELCIAFAGRRRHRSPLCIRMEHDGQVVGGRRGDIRPRARSLQARRRAAELAPRARDHRRANGRR